MTDNRPLRWILDAAADSRAKVILVTIYQSAVSVSAVVFALVMRRAIDAAVAADRAGFLRYALILMLIVVLQLLLRACIRWTNEIVKADTENALKKRAYAAILTRSYSAVSGIHTGELQNRMTNDTVVIADGVASIFPDTIALLVKLIGAASVLLLLDWKFALIFIIGGGLLMVITYIFRTRLKALHKEMQEADGSVRSFLQETLGNLLVLKSFSGEQKSEEISSRLMEDHKTARLRRNWFSVVCNIGFGAVMRGGYLFGLIWCGFGIINGAISYGTLAAVLQLVGQIQSPIASMTGYIPKYYAMLASAERLMELEELPEDEQENRLTQADVADLYSRLECIDVDGVSFAYPEDGAEPVLEDASMRIGKGEFIAITGESGIGKSTLLKLLLAVYPPDAGTLSLKGADGSVTEVSPETRSMFAYVPQGIFLMSGSLWEAVSFLSEGEIDRERVREACDIACSDFIGELPAGLDTVIGERGEGLSEGQKQRIAIARAIYAGAPVLLLDEATSALDDATEERLLRKLRQMTDRTVIIVTHRKAALDYCDRKYKVTDKGFTEV